MQIAVSPWLKKTLFSQNPSLRLSFNALTHTSKSEYTILGVQPDNYTKWDRPQHRELHPPLFTNRVWVLPKEGVNVRLTACVLVRVRV